TVRPRTDLRVFTAMRSTPLLACALRIARLCFSRRRSPYGSLLEPVLSLRRKDAAPLPSGRFAKVTVPLYYEGHAYRAGSRIRVTITAPSGDQPVWSFSNTMPSSGKTSVALAHGAGMPSRLILPLVPGVSVPTGLTPCSGLRGEHCPPY